MNIIYLNMMDEEDQCDIYDEIVVLLKEHNKGFYNNRQHIFNHLDDIILFKKDNKIVGFLIHKKNKRERKVSIEIIQSFSKGMGSFMVKYILKKFQGPFNVYATRFIYDIYNSIR